MSRSKKREAAEEASINEDVGDNENDLEPPIENSLVLVEKLQEVGINAADIQKLKQSGIFTVAGVMMQTKKTLLNIKGFSEAKVDKLLECCAKITTGIFITGFECLNRRQHLIKISTGSTALDQLLGLSGYR